jgi:hypothetical protein
VVLPLELELPELGVVELLEPELPEPELLEPELLDPELLEPELDVEFVPEPDEGLPGESSAESSAESVESEASLLSSSLSFLLSDELEASLSLSSLFKNQSKNCRLEEGSSRDIELASLSVPGCAEGTAVVCVPEGCVLDPEKPLVGAAPPP